MLTRVFLGILLSTVAPGRSLDGAFTRERALDALWGKRIRVTFTNVEEPYIFRAEDGAWAGVLPDFLEEILKEVGFILVETDVSNESTSVVGSNRNTGCPRDISKNRTDLCIGNAWVTKQRLGYAVTTPTLWMESLQVVTKMGSGASFRGVLLAAFQPFHYWLWCTILGVLLVVAVVQRFAEYQDNDRDFPEKDLLRSGIVSLYHVVFGFWWSEPSSRPVTAEGRIIAVGFGFFTLIMLSSYTASLASVLVNSRGTAEFKDLKDAISSNVPVCMFKSMLARASKVYPDLPGVAREMGATWEEGYANLDSGVCGVLLADRMFHAKAQERSERDCDKVLLSERIININVAWFVADWLAGPLSYVVSDLINRGILDDLRRVYTPRVLCEDDDALEAKSLSVDKIAGVFAIVACVMMVAVVVHCSKKSCHYSRRSETLRQTTGRLHRWWSFHSDGSSETPLRSSLRRSIQSATGDESVDPACLALLEAFRMDKRMQEMPYEKALLMMGQTQSEFNAELLQKLQELASSLENKRGRRQQPSGWSTMGYFLAPRVGYHTPPSPASSGVWDC